MSGRVICATCRHPRPLHSNGTSGCKARGCHAGPGKTPCPKFVAEVRDPDPSAVLTPVFRAPPETMPQAATG
jgi:hypothetical protein